MASAIACSEHKFSVPPAQHVSFWISAVAICSVALYTLESSQFFRLFPCSCWSIWSCRHWLLARFPLIPVDSVEDLSVSV